MSIQGFLNILTINYLSVHGGCSIDFRVLHPIILSSSRLQRLLTQSGIETIGFQSKHKYFNLDRPLMSIGKDSLNKLQFARDNLTNELRKEITNKFKSLGISTTNEEILQPSNNNVSTFFNLCIVVGSFSRLTQ